MRNNTAQASYIEISIIFWRWGTASSLDLTAVLKKACPATLPTLAAVVYVPISRSFSICVAIVKRNTVVTITAPL